MSKRLMLSGMDRTFENIMVYLQLNFMSEIGQAGYSVYGALFALCLEEKTNPTYEEVAALAGCGLTVLRRVLGELAGYHIITKIIRKDSKGAFYATLYTLNDPDEWTHSADALAARGYIQIIEPGSPSDMGGVSKSEIDTGRIAKSDSDTGGVTASEPTQIEAVSRVDEPKRGGVSAGNKPHARASTTSSPSLFDLNPRDHSDLKEDPKSTLPSSFPSVATNPPARVSEPPASTPVGRSRNDGDFSKCLRFWNKNCSKVNEAIEDALWGFYIKFGGELLFESLNEAVTANRYGNRPSMKFVEAIITRKEQDNRHAAERIEVVNRFFTEPEGPAPKRPHPIDVLRDKMRAERAAKEGK